LAVTYNKAYCFEKFCENLSLFFLQTNYGDKTTEFMTEVKIYKVVWLHHAV